MPNRIVRAELLDSESWLALKDNSDRVAYIACLLTVDNFGTMPAGPQRLVKLWRPFGIDTPEKAAKVFSDLVDVDLVRRFSADNKPYLHVPRFRQQCRYLGPLWPLSPWATDEQKQLVAKKSHVNHRDSHPDVDVDVDVKSALQKNRKTGKAKTAATRWDQTTVGIEAKGKELGIAARPAETHFDFKQRLWQVIHAEMRGKP